MTLKEYDDFCEKMWFCGNDSVGGVPQLAYLAICLSGETGEFAEKVKKTYRDEPVQIEGVRPDAREGMLLELGDVLLYLTRAARVLESSLEEVAQMNEEKLTGRKNRGTTRGSGDNR